MCIRDRPWGERLARLEDLERGAVIHGVLPDAAVSVIDVKWYGSDTVELTYKRTDGQPDNTLLYRDDEPRLSVATSAVCGCGFRKKALKTADSGSVNRLFRGTPSHSLVLVPPHTISAGIPPTGSSRALPQL